MIFSFFSTSYFFKFAALFFAPFTSRLTLLVFRNCKIAFTCFIVITTVILTLWVFLTNLQALFFFNVAAVICQQEDNSPHLQDEEDLLPLRTYRPVCQSISSRSFLNPSAVTDIPGISPCRICSSIFHPVEVLKVAKISPDLSIFAIEQGGPHAPLAYSVKFIFFEPP